MTAMQPRQLIEFLSVIGNLKCATRHNWAADGRQESVAEHSWRLAVMALLVASEIPGVDVDKAVAMCLIHDWGEAITGDIPTFLKTEQDEKIEDAAIVDLLKMLPEDTAGEFAALFREMAEMNTPEAKLVKALDKLEALISHNEAPIDTWLPREYALNLNHGDESVAFSQYLTALREEIRRDTIRKIDAEDQM